MTSNFIGNLLYTIGKNILQCRKHRPPCIYLSPRSLIESTILRMASGKWLVSGIAAVKRGPVMLLGPNDSLMDLCLVEEPCTESLVYSIVQKESIKNVINIGAFVGSYAIPLAYSGVNVVAIEPNPLASIFLKKNIEINNLRDKIQHYETAVCEKPIANLCVSSYHLGASSITHEEDCKARFKVPCINSLDGYNADLAIVDVEGSEEYVVSILPKELSHLVVEVRSTTIARVYRTLQRRGYNCIIVEKLIGSQDIFNMYCSRCHIDLTSIME